MLLTGWNLLWHGAHELRVGVRGSNDLQMLQGLEGDILVPQSEVEDEMDVARPDLKVQGKIFTNSFGKL